jgi:hypothetical protein
MPCHTLLWEIRRELVIFLSLWLGSIGSGGSTSGCGGWLGHLGSEGFRLLLGVAMARKFGESGLLEIFHNTLGDGLLDLCKHRSRYSIRN